MLVIGKSYNIGMSTSIAVKIKGETNGNVILVKNEPKYISEIVDAVCPTQSATNNPFYL